MKRIGIAAALLLAATVAFAGGGKDGTKDLKDLQLSNAQRAQIAQLQDQFKSANKAAFEAARAASKAYRRAKRDGDTAKMAELEPQVDAKRAELRALRQQQETQIRAILTPEQQAVWDSRSMRRRGRG